MLFVRFLSFWFRVCSACGSCPLGRVLSVPFFRVSVPSCWVRVGCGRAARWSRRWPSRSCGRGSFASGFRGSWFCLPVSVLPALRLSAFVWAVCPAVVSRRGGVVFSVWAFVSPAPLGADGKADDRRPFSVLPALAGAFAACAASAGAPAPAAA